MAVRLPKLSAHPISGVTYPFQPPPPDFPTRVTSTFPVLEPAPHPAEVDGARGHRLRAPFLTLPRLWGRPAALLVLAAIDRPVPLGARSETSRASASPHRIQRLFGLTDCRGPHRRPATVRLTGFSNEPIFRFPQGVGVFHGSTCLVVWTSCGASGPCNGPRPDTGLLLTTAGSLNRSWGAVAPAEGDKTRRKSGTGSYEASRDMAGPRDNFKSSQRAPKKFNHICCR